jgi:hypothetical protein
LGQYIAGDEKLFHFTGVSNMVKLILSKPDRIGLWFFELCVKLSTGKVYLLHTRLHHSDNGPVPSADVVKQWADIIMNTGREIEENPNRNTYLCFDSYYMTKDARKYLNDNKVYFTGSCVANHFKPECALVHGHDTDRTGQHSTIYNDTTNELFTYHYDTQKGVGKKYNLSYGFKRSTDKLKVRACKEEIPGYDYYKSMFELCDNFNRNLHDKTWPHVRGGKGVLGHFGRASDFYLGCILQNTFNLTEELTPANTENVCFELKCDVLATELFRHALTL